MNMLNIIKEKFKKLVNSTIKKALETAPPAKENWTRLGLEKTWLYFIVFGMLFYLFIFLKVHFNF